MVVAKEKGGNLPAALEVTDVEEGEDVADIDDKGPTLLIFCSSWSYCRT